MVAFRKWYPALAVFAFMAMPAAAQVTTGTPLQCFANAGVPPVVRSEGYTELVGDLVITCQGGNPAASFLANFQLFLNTNITSRLVTSDTSEALLMIDEPGAARLDVNGGVGTPTPFCVSPNIASNVAGSTGVASPVCNPVNTSQTNQQGTYNVFRAGRSNQPNQTIGGQSVGNENVLVWAGIPVVPPGSNRTRTFRITNVRANANGLGSSNTLIPTQILAYISVFPQGTLPIDNPQQTVGYVQRGLVFDRRTCSNSGGIDLGGTATFAQCTSTGAQRDFYDNPLRSGSLPAIGGLRFSEGFQTAFKPSILTGQSSSIPGIVYNSESGFVRPEPELAGVGTANTGTRLAARFANIPSGVRLFVSTTQTAGSTGQASTPVSSSATYIQTDPNGAGGGGFGIGVGEGSLSCGSSSAPAVEVPLVNGAGMAVWEVTASNPSAIDELVFYYAVAYRHNPGQGVPGIGTGTVIGNLAPFYTANNSVERMQGSIVPIPRFTSETATQNVVVFNLCQTNLLFPYVTNWAGFDTGLAIANTSTDPFGSPADRVQGGKCRLNYYGRLADGNAPTTTRQETERDVASGETITMVLSSGGFPGLNGNPNFQGYIIAQCDFRFAHGFAFITDGPIGQARVAEGYLALVLDGPNESGRLRGNTIGESRGH